MKEGARAREYEDALGWLREAALVYQIFCISKPGLPLSAFDDLNAFKIYMLDIGLLRELADLPPSIFTSDTPNYIEFKGALTENTVLQNLLPSLGNLPRYWVSNGIAEVDFIMQDELEIIPIEVKSSTNISSKSLSVYIKKYSPKLAIVLSAQEFSIRKNIDGTTILYIPLPMAGWIPKIIELTKK